MGWDYGEKAVTKDDNSLDAHYWAAVSLGTYGDTIGVVKALTKGIEGKFRKHLDLLVDKKPSYEFGGPLVTLGRYYFKLSGLVRVQLGQVVNEAPYRVVRAEEIPESRVDETDASIRTAKLELLASQVCLVRELTGNDSPKLILDERITFEAAVNAACASLPTEAAIRQSLLAEDDLLLRYRRAAGILDEILQRVIRLKSKGEESGAVGIN